MKFVRSPRRLALPTVTAQTADALLAIALCTTVLLGFMVAAPDVRHWFILPVFIGGVLMAADAMGMMTGSRDIFDPIAVLGALGFHFFFLAPLLHVYWGYWIDDVDAPAEWRTWVGLMAVLNAAGLLLYRWARTGSHARLAHPVPRRRWGVCPVRFAVLLGVLLVTTLGLQLWIYGTYGGIQGYIDTASEGWTSFRNMGLLFVVSESFPALALIGFAVYGLKYQRARSVFITVAVLLVFFALRVFFGGLRGSRSTIIWAMFWATGVVHLWVRPLPRRLLAGGLGILIVFMYFYGLYKGSGRGVTDILEGRAVITELEEKSRRPIQSTVLADLGRTDVQAFLLYRFLGKTDAKLAWGRTYLGALELILPRFIRGDRESVKLEIGTDFQYGAGSYDLGSLVSLRVYGLAGEALINYGPLAVPPSFLVLGWLVRRVRRFAVELQPEDTRVLLLPLLVNVCIVVLIGDSDNLLFFLVQNGMMPFFLILAARRRERRVAVAAPTPAHAGRLAVIRA